MPPSPQGFLWGNGPSTTPQGQQNILSSGTLLPVFGQAVPQQCFLSHEQLDGRALLQCGKLQSVIQHVLVLMNHCSDDLRHPALPKRLHQREYLENDDPCGVHIPLGLPLSLVQDFGRHILRCPCLVGHDAARAELGHRGDQGGPDCNVVGEQAKACELESAPVLTEQQVVGLDISVNHPMAVGEAQSVQELPQPPIPHARGHLTSALPRLSKGTLKVSAEHELHAKDQPQPVLGHEHAQEMDNIRVRQIPDRPHLVSEVR
mmetsp:Transcript_32416/g.93956  ORF Transcript_32416/g.93956 Transcript_32416/m.93956 type:complete len:261 (+) Transcript_32416:214-996(+)